MAFKVKIDIDYMLNEWDINEDYSIQFLGEEIGKIITISYTKLTNLYRIRIANTVTHQSTNYDNNDIYQLADDNNNYIFGALRVLGAMSQFMVLLNDGVASLDVDNLTGMIIYKSNSERNKLTKSLTDLGIIQGKFNNQIAVKSISIDIEDYESLANFNYVYIPKLKRYYYVNNVIFASSKFTTLQLLEDVLMSWQDLIRSQSAYLTRYSGETNYDLVDDRLPLEDTVTIEYDVHTATVSDITKVNTSFDFNYDGSSTDTATNSRFLISAIASSGASDSTQAVNGISGTTLPELKVTHAKNERYSLMNFLDLTTLAVGCANDSAQASYLMAVTLLPFDPTDVFNLDTVHSFLWLGDKFLKSDGTFTTQSADGDPCTLQIYDGTCPYIVVADFTITDTSSFKFLRRRPQATLEIYVPFVGWVDINPDLILGNRILVYYSLEFKSGMASAYIYDYTHDKLVWSGNCQLGIKCDFTTSNINENTRQKQANDLNMIIGLVASAVSVGVGAYTGNGVAVAGGVLSGAKAVINNINSKSLIFDRAQTSLGSSDNAVHSQLEVHTRLTYHKEITRDGYAMLEGYASKKCVENMESLVGYIEVGEIHFNPSGEDIYNVEIDEIVALLKGGVVI